MNYACLPWVLAHIRGMIFQMCVLIGQNYLHMYSYGGKKTLVNLETFYVRDKLAKLY